MNRLLLLTWLPAAALKLMNHLDEPTLNAYFDGDLDRQAAVITAATWPPARIARAPPRLQQVLARVEALPDLPPSRDLSLAVMAALRAKRAERAQRDRPVLQPAARLGLPLQALGAAGALAAAIPLALAALPAYTAALPAVDWTAQLTQLYTEVTAQWLNLLAAGAEWLAGALATPPPTGLPVVSSLALGGVAAAVALLFVIGNGVLLRAALGQPRAKSS